MRIKNMIVMLLLLVVATAHAHEHDAIFHALRLEIDAGESRENESVANWNLNGWIGGGTQLEVNKKKKEERGGGCLFIRLIFFGLGRRVLLSKPAPPAWRILWQV